MAFYTSPIFVILFMSSPVWLALIAVIGHNHREFSHVIWGYFWLMLVLNLLLLVSPHDFWAAFFPWKAFWLFACSIFSAFLCSAGSEQLKDTSEFVFYFVCITGVLYFIILGIPVVLKFLWGFFKVLWDLIVSAFHAIVVNP